MTAVDACPELRTFTRPATTVAGRLAILSRHMWTGAILAGGDGTRLGGLDKSGLATGAASILA